METPFLPASARTGIQTLKRFDSEFGRTSERLATGLAINRASDGPSAYFAARSLSNRAGDLNRVLDNLGTGLGAVQAAGAGIRALQRLVNLAGSIVSSAAALPEARPSATGTVNVEAAAQVTDLAGVSAGDRFSVQVGSNAAITLTVSSGDTPDDLLARLNAIDGVDAAFTASGELQITGAGGEDLTLSDVNGAPLAGLGLTQGTVAAASAVSPQRAAAAAQFDAVLTQIDQLAGESSFLGVNLLAGDSPRLVFNEDGSSGLTLTGASSTAAGLGISRSANGFATDADTAAARADITDATGSLRGFSSRLSTGLSVADTRRDFTSKLRNVLETGAGELTLADPNEEAASLLALETRKAFSAASFSIVERAQSNVLRALR